MTSRARKWSSLLAAAGLVVAAIAAVQAAEYQIDFDYPNQGDDWYGRAEGADLSRDYLGTEAAVDTYSDGDDYARGYDPAFTLHGQNVELLRMQRQQYGYRFYFEPTAECLAASDCDDGLPCNGAESCGDFQCTAGTPPSCDDGDVCTSDSCVDPTGCSNTLVPPPLEVPQLDLSLESPGSTVARLVWTAPSGDVEYYNVYRGEQVALGDLSCYDTGIVATELLDDGALPGSGLYVQLVSSFNCTQESTLGNDSAGSERSNSAPCP